ncbi:MAG: hypothetical protein FWF76_03080 [Oscillospiraceae bacterium]|nr:hypothetical protein [Oscillospiraceae bacterium]
MFKMNKKQKLLRGIALVLYSISVLSILAIPSSANFTAWQNGPTGSFTASGRSFLTQNGIRSWRNTSQWGGTIIGEHRTQANDGRTIPAFTLLSQARLYRYTTGALNSSQFATNSMDIVPGRQHVAITSHNPTTNSRHYSRGVVQFNGGSFWRGIQSPNYRIPL